MVKFCSCVYVEKDTDTDVLGSGFNHKFGSNMCT